MIQFCDQHLHVDVKLQFNRWWGGHHCLQLLDHSVGQGGCCCIAWFFLHYFHGSSFLGGCNRKTSLGNCRCWEQLWVEHGVERVHITFFMPGFALYVYPLSAIYKRLWEKEFHHQHCPRCLLNSKCTILDSSACLCCLSITLAQNLQEFLN